MSLKLITPPASEPVTLDELKAYARIDEDADDELVTSLGIAAREHIETVLGRQLVTATYEMTLPAFPGDGVIRLVRPPVQSIVSLSYRDRQGDTVTMLPADYQIDLQADPATVHPVRYWPVAGSYIDAVTVRYVAGYGDPADVPERIKLAIMALTAWWYEQREPAVVAMTSSKVPMHVDRLINAARLWRAA